MRYKPKTLEEVGIEKYLNDTVDKHNNFNFSNFKTMFEANVNITNIAKSFNVDRRTVNNWVVLYEKELANAE